MDDEEKYLKELNALRDEIKNEFDYLKIYEEARNEHYKVIDDLFRFYHKHEDDVKMMESRSDFVTAIELKTIDLNEQENYNFFMKNYVFYGKYRGTRLIEYIVKNNKNLEVNHITMLRSVQKCFCSLFKVKSAVPLLSMIEVEDVIRGGTYLVFDKGFSIYAGLDEFKNNFYICCTLTRYKEVSFFDNTVLVDQDNDIIKKFIENVSSDIESVQVSFISFFNKTDKLILDRDTRNVEE